MKTNLSSTILLACGLVALFLLGYVSGKTKAENGRLPVLVDARPGVEFEVKLARDGEPMTIVCRLDDGEHNVGEVTP